MFANHYHFPDKVLQKELDNLCTREEDIWQYNSVADWLQPNH